MKEIFKIDLDKCAEIARYEQDSQQYNNYAVSLYIVGKRIIYTEDTGAETTCYLLDAIEAEKALSNPLEYLKESARVWAEYSDDPLIELISWNLETPGGYGATSDDEGPFKIITIGCYYGGYSPVAYVLDDALDHIIFDTYVEAKAWIDDADVGDYYLKHNEAGRPDYYIVKA